MTDPPFSHRLVRVTDIRTEPVPRLAAELVHYSVDGMWVTAAMANGRRVHFMVPYVHDLDVFIRAASPNGSQRAQSI